VEIENIAEREYSEDPVMALDINQHRLDRVTDESKDIQQDVHRTLPIPTAFRSSLTERPPLRELRKAIGSSPYPLSKGRDPSRANDPVRFGKSRARASR
jgi:hypothetical protein